MSELVVQKKSKKNRAVKALALLGPVTLVVISYRVFKR